MPDSPSLDELRARLESAVALVEDLSRDLEARADASEAAEPDDAITITSWLEHMGARLETLDADVLTGSDPALLQAAIETLEARLGEHLCERRQREAHELLTSEDAPGTLYVERQPHTTTRAGRLDVRLWVWDDDQFTDWTDVVRAAAGEPSRTEEGLTLRLGEKNRTARTDIALDRRPHVYRHMGPARGPAPKGYDEWLETATGAPADVIREALVERGVPMGPSLVVTSTRDLGMVAAARVRGQTGKLRMKVGSSRYPQNLLNMLSRDQPRPLPTPWPVTLPARSRMPTRPAAHDASENEWSALSATLTHLAATAPTPPTLEDIDLPAAGTDPARRVQPGVP